MRRSDSAASVSTRRWSGVSGLNPSDSRDTISTKRFSVGTLNPSDSRDTIATRRWSTSSSAPHFGPAPHRPVIDGRDGARSRADFAFTSAAAAPKPPPDSVDTSSQADTILAQYAGGKNAPPAWCVRAMRALEDVYQKRMRKLRDHALYAEEMARQAADGVVAVDTEAARKAALAASSVARASTVSEHANIVQFEAHNENATLRHALAQAQTAAGEAEGRLVVAESQFRELEQRLEQTCDQLRRARDAEERERVRADRLAGDLHAMTDEATNTRVALERAASEAARLQEESGRLREHSRELAQGPAARPRPGGAPHPSAMGSAAEWAALKEERDALVHLLVEMRRATDKTHKAKSVRVGGGYEMLPDYLAKFTAPLPPELRLAAQPPAPAADVEGATAPTHRSQVRALSARGARGRGPPPMRHGLGTPRAAVFAPGQPASILVHQKGAPPGRARDDDAPPPLPRPAHGQYSLSVEYPAVGRRELFELHQ